jgi:hypothetical protein
MLVRLKLSMLTTDPIEQIDVIFIEDDQDQLDELEDDVIELDDGKISLTANCR